MNLNEQLRQAYNAGRRQGLYEQGRHQQLNEASSANWIRRAIRYIADIPGGGGGGGGGGAPKWTPSSNAPGMNTPGGRGLDGTAGGGANAGGGPNLGGGGGGGNSFINWPPGNLGNDTLSYLYDIPDYWNGPDSLWTTMITSLLRRLNGMVGDLASVGGIVGTEITDMIRQWARFMRNPSQANLNELNIMLSNSGMADLGWVFEVDPNTGFIRLEFLPTLAEGQTVQEYLEAMLDGMPGTYNTFFDVLVELMEVMNSVGVPAP